LEAIWPFVQFVWPIVALFLLGAFLVRVWKERGSPVEDGPEGELYRVYTREFDLELPANLRTMLTGQYSEIQTAHDEVKALRDTYVKK
jgi:hypothetical protein